MEMIINKVPSGFHWENRYAKRLKDIGFVLFVGFVLLAACAFMAASKGYPSLGQGLAIGAAGSFILAFLTTGPNPWARTTQGLDKRRHTREFALGQFWADRGLPTDRFTVLSGVGDCWQSINTDLFNTELASRCGLVGVVLHGRTNLRVRYASYPALDFPMVGYMRGITLEQQSVFVVSLDDKKTPTGYQILRIEESGEGLCRATLMDDFPPDVLRAVLSQFTDELPYLFGGADGSLESKDLIDALAPQGAKEPKKGPLDLKLVPA